MSVAVRATLDPAAASASFAAPAGLSVPSDADVSLTGSHIRPQPGYGYDERRHVTVWGPAIISPDGRQISIAAARAWGWDEAEVPFFEYSERSVGQSRKYFDALSVERGTPVKPRLSMGSLVLRTTRLPFLSATIVPVLLGILIAAGHGAFDLLTAVLTVIGASFVQLGLNVANDVFDTAQGADDANVTPTKYSGGSRVIQYGLVSFRRMASLATIFYVAAGVIGLLLLVLRGSPALLVIGVVGFIVSLGYTAPPLKLVYRGLGEIAVAIGFGPLMLLGAYVVQTRGVLTWEPVVASLPVALLVALILYVNEIPDRRGDARAGKRTLPVRLSKDTVIAGYRLAAMAAYAIVIVGVARRPPADPGVTRPAHGASRPPGFARPRTELRQPVRPDVGHGREHQRPPIRGAAAHGRLPRRPDRWSGGSVGGFVRRLTARRSARKRPAGGPGRARRLRGTRRPKPP